MVPIAGEYSDQQIEQGRHCKSMRYFLDTEFIERPGNIQLISIGIVSECGRTFYAENTSFDERDADKWVWENVLSRLLWWRTNNVPFNRCKIDREGMHIYETYGPLPLIRNALIEFFESDNSKIEFWGYFADYDWVIFCWIFGKMIDLPKHFPKYCNDIKQ